MIDIELICRLTASVTEAGSTEGLAVLKVRVPLEVPGRQCSGGLLRLVCLERALIGVLI